MILRYTAAWLILVVVAILNGALREAVFKNRLDELHAHQLSTISGVILLGLVIWCLSRKWPLSSARQAWTVGFMWLALTIVFEFLFGYYIVGHSWSSLLHDYDLLAGRLWLAVLIWTTVAPYVFYRITLRQT